jgi:hypothetical protein
MFEIKPNFYYLFEGIPLLALTDIKSKRASYQDKRADSNDQKCKSIVLASHNNAYTKNIEMLPNFNMIMYFE